MMIPFLAVGLMVAIIVIRALVHGVQEHRRYRKLPADAWVPMGNDRVMRRGTGGIVVEFEAAQEDRR